MSCSRNSNRVFRVDQTINQFSRSSHFNGPIFAQISTTWALNKFDLSESRGAWQSGGELRHTAALRNLVDISRWVHTLVTLAAVLVSTPLVQVIYDPCIHHTHAFVARGQRKCELIYSRHLLWEHSRLTEDKSTGAAHLLLLSFLPYRKIYTWRCLNLLTRAREAISLEISTFATSLRNALRDSPFLAFCKWIYLFNFFAPISSNSTSYKGKCENYFPVDKWRRWSITVNENLNFVNANNSFLCISFRSRVYIGQFITRIR